MTDLNTEVVNGRIVTVATGWWAKNTQPPHKDLYCIHRVELTIACNECRDKTVSNEEK